MAYTKKEYDILLYLRKKPRKTAKVYKKFKPKSMETWNVWFTDFRNLCYLEPDGSKILELTGEIHLNEIGETVAQAEFDRRFDMYFTRIMALLALAASVVALIIQAVG